MSGFQVIETVSVIHSPLVEKSNMSKEDRKSLPTTNASGLEEQCNDSKDQSSTSIIETQFLHTSGNTCTKPENDNANSEGKISPKSRTESTRLLQPQPTGGQQSSRRSLDDATLEAIKTFLQTEKGWKDHLDDEDVVSFSVQSSRYANERTRYRQNLLEGSDMDEGETSFDRVYKEEENYALGNEFFKQVVRSSQSLAESSALSGKFQMHKRTVNWLKRAAGLQRPYDPLEHQGNQSDSDDVETDGGGDTAPRRLTRGMVRNTRYKRRQEKIRQETQGIRDLLSAIEGLEIERGLPFETTSKLVSTKFVFSPSFTTIFILNSTKSIPCF